MITHYDMHTGECIRAEETPDLAVDTSVASEMLAPRLLTVAEAIAQETPSINAHPAVVMLPIAALCEEAG